MKEINLYKIKELALKSKRRVFSVIDLSNLINKPKAITRVYMGRLIKNKLAEKICFGYITFTTNEYIIANQFLEPSYISMNTALNYTGIIQQIPATIECVSPLQAKLKSDYKYYKLDPKIFFGYKKELAENTYYFVAEPEKAIIDLIYFNGFSESYIDDKLQKLNIEKLKGYIKKYKNIKGYRTKRVLKIGEYLDRQRRNNKTSKT